VQGILRAQIIGCDNLANVDRFGRSDPFVVCQFGDDKKKHQKTSVINNCLNPRWEGEKEEHMEWFVYDKGQSLHIKVRDYSAEGFPTRLHNPHISPHPLSLPLLLGRMVYGMQVKDHDVGRSQLLGYTEVNVNMLCNNTTHRLVLPLSGSKGTITLDLEYVQCA